VTAAHANPMLSQTPTIGRPLSTCPTASASPWPGGYFEVQVGWWIMCILSKCTHIGCVGFVSRPEVNVSAARR